MSGWVFVLVIAAAVVVGLWVFARRDAKRHGTSTREEFAGICAVAVEATSQKEARKQQALAVLAERGEVANADIREVLHVSARSVRRYMSELVAEGLVEQVGEDGRSVVYRLPSRSRTLGESHEDSLPEQAGPKTTTT